MGMWYSEDQRTNTLNKNMFVKERITSSGFGNYFVLNSEHDWEDLQKNIIKTSIDMHFQWP